MGRPAIEEATRLGDGRDDALWPDHLVPASVCVAALRHSLASMDSPSRLASPASCILSVRQRSGFLPQRSPEPLGETVDDHHRILVDVVDI